MKSTHLHIRQDDAVIVTLTSLQKGEVLHTGDQTVTLREDVPSGHKVAIRDIEPGEEVIKYGFPIGVAKQRIRVGDWVHTHNVRTKLDSTLSYDYQAENSKVKAQPSDRTFLGYRRDDGQVGIRNEIWIINTVGCINKTAEVLAKMANQQFADAGIDGIYHYPHPFGCSQLGDDLHNTQKILRNLVQHPNAAGVLVIGLGCENNHIAAFKNVVGHVNEDRVKYIVSQEVEDELQAGLTAIGELVHYAEKFEREPVPVSELKIGLKCGGSDGFSGITANPLVGALSDRLIGEGGTTILTEVPEMFGAETILMNRAVDENVFSDMVHLINDFKEYFIKHDQPVYENPSPGNKSGGITTLEEKSLGCVQKGGLADVVDVLPYGGTVEKKGLNIVQGPGNDLVSVTTLAAAGAHIVIFTTGRGTPFGGPVPTIKMSTNSDLYQRKQNWIDFDAGPILEGMSIEDLQQQLYDYVLELASGGKQTHNEKNGFKEIAIFKDGVIL
ncbi:UxaA family hydrolase [Caldalkalibacillus salinus]|uniref:UxaA family hydrolase n=1 Tax=Caldalkalibacillus salinus TaxID=2803787 RepID=UPI001921A4C6|nr:altronate dehydratase family protein [Caldalkalibacillus salinus]